jgi:hypothetical protein
MKYFVSDQALKYDGSQLRSLFAYTTFKIQGDSIVSWPGECDIPFSNMTDGEDVVLESPIRGASMLHFIIEKFHLSLMGAVAYQRLLTCMALAELQSLTDGKFNFRRDGDDIFLDDRKLSISVATCSPVSALIHFAVNINNENTPVETLSLSDLKIDTFVFARKLTEAFSAEVKSMDVAASKVRPAH